MQIAIADDITGAAEIAAIAHQAGLHTEVSTQLQPSSTADLQVIDTDTRCLSGTHAAAAIRELIKLLQIGGCSLIYKKVDSVLRGNVIAELAAVLKTLKLKRILLIPANPSKGRVIIQGRYYIDGIPLDQTEFANDPVHPARSSLLLDLLGHSEEVGIHLTSPAEYRYSNTGILVPDICGSDELDLWAKTLDDQCLPAGGAEFFAAVIRSRFQVRPVSTTLGPLPTGPRLVVCGSRSDRSHKAIDEAVAAGIPVCMMPSQLLSTDTEDQDSLASWARQVISAISSHGLAIAAIPHCHATSSPAQLVRLMAGLVMAVLNRLELTEIYLEGGSTARAVLDQAGIKTLQVQGQYGPGVVRLSAKGCGLFITLKPGSYPWPCSIWRFLMESKG